MSRTKKRGGVSSPIKKYISFSGSTGTFSYYDSDNKKKVDIKSLTVIALDSRSSITGFNESAGARITSNLVASTTKENLKVVSFINGKPSVLAEGLYQDIKSKLKEFGGKFTTNLICLADVGDGLEIVNLQLSGVALTSWIDFLVDYPNDGYYDYAITIGKGVLTVREKGKNVPVTKEQEAELDAKLKKNPRHKQPIWYYVLDFKVEDLTEEQSEIAVEEDGKLQEYFTALSGRVTDGAENSAEPSAPEDVDEEEKDDLPF